MSDQIYAPATLFLGKEIRTDSGQRGWVGPRVSSCGEKNLSLLPETKSWFLGSLAHHSLVTVPTKCPSYTNIAYFTLWIDFIVYPVHLYFCPFSLTHTTSLIIHFPSYPYIFPLLKCHYLVLPPPIGTTPFLYQSFILNVYALRMKARSSSKTLIPVYQITQPFYMTASCLLFFHSRFKINHHTNWY